MSVMIYVWLDAYFFCWVIIINWAAHDWQYPQLVYSVFVSVFWTEDDGFLILPMTWKSCFTLPLVSFNIYSEIFSFPTLNNGICYIWRGTKFIYYWMVAKVLYYLLSFFEETNTHTHTHTHTHKPLQKSIKLCSW